MHNEHFGDIFDQFLTGRGVTADGLAKQTNIPKQTLASWREGRTRNPRNIDDILSVSQALDLSSNELDQLLAPTSHPPVAELFKRPNLKDSLDWLNKLPDAPFQADPMTNLLVGREELLATLSSKIIDGLQICLLHGLGGIGKTSIANALAHKLRRHFPDGILWVDLTNSLIDRKLNEDLILHALTTCLGAYGHPTTGLSTLPAMKSVYRDILSRKKLLLILDNAHGTLDSEHFLFDFETSGSTLIVSSRDERTLNKHNPTIQHVAPLDKAASHQILRELIGSDCFKAEADASENIITLLGGHPLALTIVGSDLKYTTGLKLDEYVIALESADQLDMLEDDHSKDSVQASFEIGYRHLDEPTQNLFAILSLFDGPTFSQEAILALIPDEPGIKVKKRLGILQSRSLIDQAPDQLAESPRFQMHPLLRTFARRKLITHLPAPALETRLNQFFASLVENLNQQADYQTLELDWPNIYQVLNRGETAEIDPILYQSLIADLTRLDLGVSGFLGASGRWQTALNLLEHAPQSDDPIINLSILMSKASFYARFHKLDKARSNFEKALELIATLTPTDQTRLFEAQACEWLAQISKDEDIEEALSWTDRGLEQLEQIEGTIFQKEKSYLQVRQGTLIGQYFGDIPAAKTLISQATGQLKETPSSAYVSGLMSLGHIYSLEGDDSAALDYWEEAAILAENLNDRWRLLGIRQNIAIILSRWGQFHRSVLLQEEVKDAYIKMGDVGREAILLVNLVEDYTFLHQHKRVENYLQQAFELGQKYNLPEVSIRAHLNSSQYALFNLDPESALIDLNSAQDLMRGSKIAKLLPELEKLKIEYFVQKNKFEAALEGCQTLLGQTLDKWMVGQLLRLKALALSGLDHYLEAVAEFERSLKYFSEIDAKYERVRTSLDWAIIANKKQDVEVANQLWESANELLLELDLLHPPSKNRPLFSG